MPCWERAGSYSCPVISMSMILAEKYHSCGNDFLIVAAGEVQPEHYSNLAQAICDRNFGVGADGCVVVRESSSAQFHLKIFNRDGTEAAMSGNGFRCGCAFLHRHGRVSQPEVTVQTGSGVKKYTLLEKAEGFWKYRSRMGEPAFEPAAIPFKASSELEQVVDYSLEVPGGTVSITALWVGNPQCVVFVEEFPTGVEFERMGSGLECHLSFPERTNVSFVQVKDSHHLTIKLWERGVGETHSSGTGSCGAAVAAIRSGQAQSPVDVQSPKGSQQVEWNPGNEILLTGEAEFIAEVKFHWKQGV